jgi:hypothetical protein
MNSMSDWGLRFVRWGMGLTILGLVTGYIPLGHYLMKDSLPSCPTAPVHGHSILLSFVGMTMFGLAYAALPLWMNGGQAPLRLVRMHFWLAVAGIIGLSVNGTIGYELVKHLWEPEFYYNGPAGQGLRNWWFAADAMFLTMYGAGCGVFLYIVTKKTSYARAVAPV